MRNICKIFIGYLICFTSNVFAQPYTLQSVGLSNPFSLNIYFDEKGRGASVKYHGQKSIIALRIKSFKADTSGRSDGQPDWETFVWDEIIDGKVNGTYQLTHDINTVKTAWYVRKKDGKRFPLKRIESTIAVGYNQYLLHGATISFNHLTNNKLSIQYADGQKLATTLPDFDSPNAVRKSNIADYNFDGYDDVAFSIPDAGMGVYRMFSIWIYNPISKGFAELPEPNYSKAKCSCLCDVTLDPKKKLLYTACRGGARWWQDVYRFGAGNRLIWISAKETNN